MNQILLFGACFILMLFNQCGQRKQADLRVKSESKRFVQNANDITVGSFCDKCETMYEGMPAVELIGSKTELAPADEPGERMEINATVVKPDGVTPAKEVIFYIYHTDSKGKYAPLPDQQEGRINGHLRGWVKTNAVGNFSFSSIRPAPYPGRKDPAHIHLLVKEEGKTLYYIDEIWFDDDPLITQEKRRSQEKRGGDLVIHLNRNKDKWTGNVRIILGMNIPDYK